MGRRARPDEHGFTLIELVIGMVLLAIAIAMVGTAVVNALGGAASSTGGAASDSAIARVTARFQDDLAVAESADHAASLVREQAVLDGALRTGANASSDDPSNPNTDVDLDDVLQATPTLFQVQADVVRSSPGVECVTWEARVAGTKYEIVRTVSAPGCGGTITTDILLEGRSDATNAVLQPFSYRLMCSRTDCAGSSAPAGSPCGQWTETSVGARKQRRWIVGVQAQFVAHSGKLAMSAASGATMNIRSREEHMWRTALGC